MDVQRQVVTVGRNETRRRPVDGPRSGQVRNNLVKSSIRNTPSVDQNADLQNVARVAQQQLPVAKTIPPMVGAKVGGKNSTLSGNSGGVSRSPLKSVVQ